MHKYKIKFTLCSGNWFTRLLGGSSFCKNFESEKDIIDLQKNIKDAIDLAINRKDFHE